MAPVAMLAGSRSPTLQRVAPAAPRPALRPGARVRVTAPLVNHGLPKFRGGLPVQGLEGVVVANVAEWQGKVLSASHPWKVALEVPTASGGVSKGIMHLIPVGGMQPALNSRSAAAPAAGMARAARPAPRRAVRAQAKSDNAPVLAIAGVTGAVGQEFLRVLKERDFPYSDVRMLASKRSAGKQVDFDGKTYEIEELTESSFEGVDIALFSAGGSISKRFAEPASALGATVVDNSSAFRMTEGVPLVIPEVNPEAMAHVKAGHGGIVANPNCSTIIALMAATPLHREWGVKRMVVSTYQAASGAGQAAMDELWLQTQEHLAGKEVTKKIFPLQYAFNLFSHNSPVQPNGYNEEELKLVKETAKIWGTDDVRVTATCVRVPVMRAHAESITLEFERDVDEARALELLSAFPGVTVKDDRANNSFPTPLDASHLDDVLVGRVRRDYSAPEGKGLNLFVCGDQIKKGAALNAVQIAELLL